MDNFVASLKTSNADMSQADREACFKAAKSRFIMSTVVILGLALASLLS